MRATLEPLNMIVLWRTGGSRKFLNWAPFPCDEFVEEKSTIKIYSKLLSVHWNKKMFSFFNHIYLFSYEVSRIKNIQNYVWFQI